MNTLILTLALFAQDPEAFDRARDLYDEGTSQYESADYTGAIESFTESLLLTAELPEDLAKPIRLQLLYNIAGAHEKAYEIDQDEAHLRQALQLFKRYADEQPDDMDSLDGDVAIHRVEKKLRALDVPTAEPEPEKTALPPPVAKPDDKRRKLGIGLLAGGSAVAVGGIGLLIYGSTFKGRAERTVNDTTGGDPNHDYWPQGQQHIADEKQRGAIFMGVGGGVAALGLVGAVVGGLQIKKAKTRVSFAPAYSGQFAGVTVTGRF